MSLYRLKCAVQTYDWGKNSNESLVAKLIPAACGPHYKVETDKNYAEIWMGTHPNGPSYLYEDPQKALATLLASSPDTFIGPTTLSKFATTSGQTSSRRQPELPFLFKVLSIAKALPLQAHPDKSQAEGLHLKDQESFVDTNHKPEIALALGDFAAFVGFKPVKQIRKIFDDTPELRAAVGKPITVNDADSAKKIISSILSRSHKEIKPYILSLMDRTATLQDTQTRLVHALYLQYPDDPGVLVAPLLMNYVTLKKGQALFINANEAHAYLFGDIIECMAVSDNVVNAAFVAPNGKDVGMFVDMLTSDNFKPANAYALPSQQYEASQLGRTITYNPLTVQEFQVLYTRIDMNHKQEILSPVEGPTVGIVLKGEIVVSAFKKSEHKEHDTLARGGVIFIPPRHQVEVMITKGEEAEIYWAVCA